MFNRINTLQTLLMKCQWSREPKWYGARVSKASILTSRKTEIVTSAGGRNITRASCRRRTGTIVPRAENFSDMMTASQKILSDGSGSRNNHRYAVVVQDLATQWLQSYPCKTKTSHATQKSLMKFLEPTRQPKVICIDTSGNLASPVKNCPGVIVRQLHTDQKQMGLLKDQCVELRNGHLRYCCNQVWMKKW